MSRFFITGTDTHIGKTFITCGFLQALQRKCFRTIAIKPVASGCILTKHGLRNNDALLLQANATVQLPYSLINPIAFSDAIAPHIAATQQNIRLNTINIATQCQPALNTPADFYFIEGIGGWHVPLSASDSMVDLVKLLKCQVILVIGIKLGCLNHALLTHDAILNSGCNLFGWVANCVDATMPVVEENIQFLKNIIRSPLLGIVPFNCNAADYLKPLL